MAMEFEGHFFIGADNGIFSLIKEGLKAKKTVDRQVGAWQSSKITPYS